MKKENSFLLAVTFILFSYIGVAQNDVSTPSGYEEIAQAEGDLDKDKLAEKAIVYRTKEGSEIRIYKMKAGKWELWHTSKGAILLETDSTVLRFYNIKIERGCIVTIHSTPGHAEWSYTHRYRFQDGLWKLIGVTENTGYYCDYFSSIDCNLITGKVVYDYEKQKCDEEYNETTVEKKHEEHTVKFKELPNMDEVSVSNHQVKLPDTTISLSY